MTALKVLAVIVLLIIAIGMLRLRVRVRYRDETELIVGASLLTFRIMPRRKKRVSLRKYSLKNIRRRELEAGKPKKEKPKKEKKKKKQPVSTEEKPQKEKKKMTVDELLELVGSLVDIVGGVFGKFGRYSRIDVRKLYIRVASEDPAKTAQLYGIVSQALVYMREIFVNVKNFRLHNDTRVGVEADFMSDKIIAEVDLEYSIRLWQILSIGIGAGIGALKAFILPKPEQSAQSNNKNGKNSAKNIKRKKKKKKNTNKNGGSANV